MATAMYPHLADAYLMSNVLYGDQAAGQQIGYYQNTLEMQINAAKNSGNPDLIRLAKSLEEEIQRIERLTPDDICSPFPDLSLA